MSVRIPREVRTFMVFPYLCVLIGLAAGYGGERKEVWSTLNGVSRIAVGKVPATNKVISQWLWRVAKV